MARALKVSPVLLNVINYHPLRSGLVIVIRQTRRYGFSVPGFAAAALAFLNFLFVLFLLPDSKHRVPAFLGKCLLSLLIFCVF